MLVDPKRVFFMLLGPASVKALRKSLMKLSPELLKAAHKMSMKLTTEKWNRKLFTKVVVRFTLDVPCPSALIGRQ